MKIQLCFLLESNPVFHGTSAFLYQVQHFCIQVAPLPKLQYIYPRILLRVRRLTRQSDFCIELSIGIVKLATGGLYREL